MAIPGLTPSLDLRAKVRTGEKREVVKNGKTISFPASTDYFICDEPDFKRVCGDRPKELTVSLPFERPEDNFSTGLEQWAGAMLVCYTKGEDSGQGHAIAYRKATMKKAGRDVNLLDGFKTLTDTPMGNDRRLVACFGRDCHMMKVKDGCKPMGRLQFFIKGIDPRLGVYQLDTKSWNTIEKIEGFLSLIGDPRGQELTLRVEMWQRGTSKFPVVTLEGVNSEVDIETEGVNVKVDTAHDVAIADVLALLHKALWSGTDSPTDDVKPQLASALDLTNPGWRDNPAFIDRIKEIGAVEAAKGLLKRYEL